MEKARRPRLVRRRMSEEYQEMYEVRIEGISLGEHGTTRT